MKKTKIKRKNNLIYLFGLSLIILGLFLFFRDFYNEKEQEQLEKTSIKEYYDNVKIKESEITYENKSAETQKKTTPKKNKKIDYVAVLKIPKINLTKGLVNKDNPLNNVKYGIEILANSSMPDKEKTNLILASHSGTASISYFDKLDKLKINDKVFIDYENKTYTYNVVNIYDVIKNGKVNLLYNKNKNNLILITCRRNTNKQIVVICELEKIESIA